MPGLVGRVRLEWGHSLASPPHPSLVLIPPGLRVVLLGDAGPQSGVRVPLPRQGGAEGSGCALRLQRCGQRRWDGHGWWGLHGALDPGAPLL